MNHLSAFLKSWQSQATAQAATLSVLIGTYTIIALTLLVHHNLEHLLSKWGSEVKLSVYLNDDVQVDATSKIQNQIKESGFFENIKYISKDAALVDFQKRMGSLAPNILEDRTFENPLPASFEAVLSPGVGKTAIAELPRIAEALMKLSGVEDASYGQGWVENYAAVLKVFRVSSLALIFTLAMGCLLVIGNSIKSSIMARRDEIEVLELFGATERMILIPFLGEGAIIGLLGSMGALSLAGLIYFWQSTLLVEQLGFWGLAELLSFLPLGTSLMFILTGTILGAIGSYLCVRQINTGWAAAER